MKYKLHRVARNSDGWVRPSPGRLGAGDVGEYVKEHGFGHEDWNFNFSFASNGEMLGYTVARPAAKLAAEKFGVILATYDSKGWKAVGYYRGANFRTKTGPYHDAAIEQMAIDVFELAEKNSVSPEYLDTLPNIENKIRTEFIHGCWIIATKQVSAFTEPMPIPRRVFNPGAVRMVTSFNLSENQFNAITRLEDIPTDHGDELEQEEGARTLRLHQFIERRRGLVSAFKKSLTSFACVICNFNFEQRYGPLGKEFIECHHIRPVAEMRPGDKTKLSDLRAVCSNCHRMLHKSSPMLAVEELRKQLKVDLSGPLPLRQADGAIPFRT